MTEQDRPQGEGQPPRQHISARVPENVSRGTFSTGVLVMTGASEFILDFIQNLGQPAQVAARIVMPHATVPQFIQALKTNLDLYRNQFVSAAPLQSDCWVANSSTWGSKQQESTKRTAKPKRMLMTSRHN